jgi:hypothetical protein
VIRVVNRKRKANGLELKFDVAKCYKHGEHEVNIKIASSFSEPTLRTRSSKVIRKL